MKTAPLLLCVFLSALLNAAESKSFEVRGRMETVVLSQDGPARTTSRAFALATDGADVLIRINAATTDLRVDYSEFGTDGTNGFHFAKTLLHAGPDPKRDVANDAIMTIEPSPVPQRSAGGLKYVWLVYAAQRELKGRTESFLRPWAYVVPRGRERDQQLGDMLREHLLFRAEWTFDKQEPQSLQTFVDYREGKLASDRYSQSLLPAEFMSGRTNSRIEVLAWTNVAGLHIPLRAQMISYETDMEKADGPLRARATHVLVVTNVVAGTSRHSFVPKLTQATQVIDYRFAEERRRPAYYLSTNGVIFHTAEEAQAHSK